MNFNVRILAVSTFILVSLATEATASELHHLELHHLSYDLQEEWRVETDESNLLGQIVKVETDADGRVYLFDPQFFHVLVYDKNGTFLRSLFEKGEGPAEVQRPLDMVVMDDGRVGLVENYPGAIVFVHPDGSPATRLRITTPGGDAVSLKSARSAGDRLIVGGTMFEQGTSSDQSVRKHFLGQVGDDGEIEFIYAEFIDDKQGDRFTFIERAQLPSFWLAQAVREDGTVYVACDRDKYEISEFDVDNSLTRKLLGNAKAVRRTSEDNALFRCRLLGGEDPPQQLNLVFEDHHPAIEFFTEGMKVAADGRLWVLSSRGARPETPGVMAEFDVFDDLGHLCEKVTIHGPHAATDVGIVFYGADKILVLEGLVDSIFARYSPSGTAPTCGERVPKLPAVVCYRLMPRE